MVYCLFDDCIIVFNLATDYFASKQK